MRSSSKKTIVLGVVVIVIAAVIATAILFLPKRSVAPTVPAQRAMSNTTSTAPMKMAPIPRGSQTYQIMQAAGVMPKIVQATVNPVDVHVGDTQTLTVIVSDPDPIISVVATIQTDNGTTTVPLALVGPAALNDVAPQKYFVNAQNQVALVNPNNSSGTGNVAQAAQGDEKYSAAWTVKDTHVARYYTIFTATDAKGNVNSARMNWTDAMCSWNGQNNYGGGTWDANAAYGSLGCNFGLNETDGVENGNATIDAPVTLANNSTFVINSGRSMTISGSGQISLPTNTPLGQIVFGQDMYCAPTTWVTTFSSPADGTYQESRSSLNNMVYPGSGAYGGSTLTNYGPNTFNYNCSAATTQLITAVGQFSGGGCQNPAYGQCYAITRTPNRGPAWDSAYGGAPVCGQAGHLIGLSPTSAQCGSAYCGVAPADTLSVQTCN